MRTYNKICEEFKSFFIENYGGRYKIVKDLEELKSVAVHIETHGIKYYLDRQVLCRGKEVYDSLAKHMIKAFDDQFSELEKIVKSELILHVDPSKNYSIKASLILWTI